MNACAPDISDLFFARYEAGGRGEGGAYDCFGLFAEICRRRGVAIPQHPTPADHGERQRLILDEIARHWLPLERPEPWCGVAFRIGPFVAHIGTVLADGWHFLHANEATGITASRLDHPLWAESIAGYYRHV